MYYFNTSYSKCYDYVTLRAELHTICASSFYLIRTRARKAILHCTSYGREVLPFYTFPLTGYIFKFALPIAFTGDSISSEKTPPDNTFSTL